MSPKGVNRDFLQSPHCAANCLQHVRSSGQGAAVCKSRATHRAPIIYNMPSAKWCKRIAQLLSLNELKSHLASFRRLKSFTDQGEEESRVPEEKKPDDELQRVPQTEA